MTTDDALNMVDFGEAKISPDGSFVVWGKSELNWDDNKRETTFFHTTSDGEKTYQYLGEDGGSSLSFSPDGTYLALKRSVDGKSQIFLMPVAGGEAVQLTEHDVSVGSYEWGKDSKTIYFQSDVIKSEEEKEAYEAGYDHVLIDEAPNGQREGSWHTIWSIDIESKETEKLIHEEVRIGDFTISPDQKHLLYTGRFENRRNQPYLSEIFLIEVGDSTATQLTDNEVPEGGLTWMPDSKAFLYSANSDTDWELRQAKLWKMSIDDASYEMVSGNFEGDMRGYKLSDDGKTVYFNGLVKTNTNFFKLNLKNGKIKQLTDFEGTFYVRDYSTEQKHLLISKESITTPPDLFTATLSNPEKTTRLTDLNPWVQDSLILADYDVVSWKSNDGLEIEGIQYLPEDHENDGTSKFLLHIHGGPAGVFSNSFRAQYHVWAGLGYVQLAPNVRGSTGYGDEFLRGNMNDIGDGDYLDLMSGVDMLIADDAIDERKMGVRGWSYGGILGGTVITKTDRFKAASLGAGVFDWSSEYAMGFNYDVRLWYIGGEPWTNTEEFRNRSAATHAEDVTTPTLFIHGERDRVDTPQQSMIFFTYLMDIGKVDTRYLLLKREGHGISEPRNQRTRDIEEIKWIEKYVTGDEWTPWERK